MKLTKQQLKQQTELFNLINSKDTFTDEETELFYTEANEGFIGDVTSNSAYFTPWRMALDFALMTSTCEIMVDMCAGWGALSAAHLWRETYDGIIKKIICVERDPRYIEIGKKLVRSNKNTEVIWIQGDMFDEKMWDDIVKEHGEIDSIFSNPPYGKVTKTDQDRSWLKYTGAELDVAAIEIGIKRARNCSFILPQGSCTFRASGRPYPEHVENRKIAKLKKDMGAEFYMSWCSIDTCFYEQQFKNTKIVVECLTIEDYRKLDFLRDI